MDICKAVGMTASAAGTLMYLAAGEYGWAAIDAAVFATFIFMRES